MIVLLVLLDIYLASRFGVLFFNYYTALDCLIFPSFK